MGGVAGDLGQAREFPGVDGRAALTLPSPQQNRSVDVIVLTRVWREIEASDWNKYQRRERSDDQTRNTKWLPEEELLSSDV